MKHYLIELSDNETRIESQETIDKWIESAEKFDGFYGFTVLREATAEEIEESNKHLLRNKSGSFNFNPMVKVYGPGPEDKRCKHCKFCYSKSFSKRYYKCEFRGDTNGTATDHRVNWPTCSKFELS